MQACTVIIQTNHNFHTIMGDLRIIETFIKPFNKMCQWLV